MDAIPALNSAGTSACTAAAFVVVACFGVAVILGFAVCA
jgi:hypothetical protein